MARKGVSRARVFGIALLLGFSLFALVSGPGQAPRTQPCPFSSPAKGTLDGGGEILSPCPSGPTRFSFVGSPSSEQGQGVAVDNAGFVYVTGYTGGAGMPTTPGAFDTTFNGGNDMWVGKFDPNLTTLIWGTFLGGGSVDSGQELRVDASGNVYVMGHAGPGMPTTVGAFDTTYNGGPFNSADDAYVAKLDATGSTLLYGSYLGGSDSDKAWDFDMDGTGALYLTGFTYSTDFPTTFGAYDRVHAGGADGYIAKMQLLGGGASDLVYATFLGGAAEDYSRGIAMDSVGSAYVTGDTASSDFPYTSGAFGGPTTGTFITKLDPTGSSISYSARLKLSTGWAVDVDALGQAYVTGSTGSNNFPTTPGAYDQTRNGGDDVFVTKFNMAGSALVYSTFLGGKANERGRALFVDTDDTVYVSGYEASSNFPTTSDALDTTFNGVNDAFLTRLNAAGSGLVYSTYLGGTSNDIGTSLRLDTSGKVFVAGYTQSANFPTSSGAYDTSHNGGDDAFFGWLD